MIVIHGETNEGRRLVVVQLDADDVKKLAFGRGAISISQDTRDSFPNDLELVLTGMDAGELVKMLNAAGAVSFKGTDDAGRKLLG